METSFENFLSRQNQSSHTNKAQFSLFCEANLTRVIFVHASGNHKQNFARLIGGNP